MRLLSLLSMTLMTVCSLSVGALAKSYDVIVLTDALDKPWAMEVIGTDQFIISERSGALRLYTKTGLSASIKNLPQVYFKGQGGMLDIALHPEFASNSELFISYSSGDDEANTLVVSRGVLNRSEHRIDGLKEIFEVLPHRATPVHYGGRIAVLPDDTLLVTSGDGFDYRESAQRMDSLMGKMLRVDFNGNAATDNPFPSDGLDRFIWTLGHRNPQALLFDGLSGWVIAHEHGPAGGDEINILTAGKNYGWPVITNGKDYSGANISPFKEYEGMEQPWFDWTPSVAPSDMILYRGQQFPELNGKLLVTTLKTKAVLVIDINNQNAVQTAVLLSHLNERFRAVQQDHKGNIYLLTDSGKLLKLDIH